MASDKEPDTKLMVPDHFVIASPILDCCDELLAFDMGGPVTATAGISFWPGHGMFFTTLQQHKLRSGARAAS